MTRANKAISLGISALIAIAIILVVGFGMFLGTVLNTTNTTSIGTISTHENTTFAVGSVEFSGAWHYVGNITLTGEQSVCYILRLPCPSNPSNSAMVFSDGASTAYVEFANGNKIEYTIVLINGELYCVSPNDNIPSEPACPSVISTSNSISTISPTT